MKTAEIIKYWRDALQGGEYARGFGLVSAKRTGTQERKEIHYDCVKTMEELRVYTGKERLQEFICLYALYRTVQLMTGKMQIGLMVSCEDKRYPLIFTIDERASVKAEIQRLYEGYKKLYVIASCTNSAIIKFLPEEEQECLLGERHLGFSYYGTKENYEELQILPEKVSLQYLDGNMSEEYAKTVLYHYDHVLGQVITLLKNHGNSVEITLLTKEERERVLGFSYGKAEELSYKGSMYSRVVKIANSQPDHLAVCCNNEKLTYSNLCIRSAKIAKELRNQGMKRESRIALLCENSVDTIASLLAIWAIGAVYIPIGTHLTKEKVANMLTLAKAELMVFVGPRTLVELEEKTSNKLDGYGIIPVDYQDINIPKLVLHQWDRESDLEFHKDLRKELEQEEGDQLHIIFTSGTTGEPKGVLIEREGFENLCEWYAKEFHFDREARSLLLTSFSFDASVKNLIVPLLTGGTLYLVPDTLYDVPAIHTILETCQITHVNTVPSLFDQIMELDEKDSYRHLESLQEIILGGEKFSKTQIRSWLTKKKSKVRISNVYGPTEATDLVTFHTVTQEELDKDRIPIGTPLPNKQVYVLNENRTLCACYQEGMIYVSGTGVITNYANPETGKEKFIKLRIGSLERILYATGDLGCWNSCGELEYIGRKDHQVKINGQRIELEEIEQVVQRFPSVKQSAAIIKQVENQRKELIVFYTMDQTVCDRVQEEAELKKYVESQLSSSLMPNQFCRIEQFPITSHGKIDRKKLLELANSKQGHIEGKEPKTDMEHVVHDIWCRILLQDKIGVDVSFFEAGGNSLLLNRLKAEMDRVGGCTLQLTDYFEYPTIEAIARQIES